MTALLRHGWYALNKKPVSCSVCAARLGLILLVAPLPALLIPAMADGRSFNIGVMLFPNLTAQGNSCDGRFLATMLNIGTAYREHPHLIMNTLNEGAEILFRTKHEVLAAPFHMNVSGNIDSYNFFTATDPAVAEAIIRRRGADIVVMCKNISELYLKPSEETVYDEDGKQNEGESSPFIQQLADGKIPPWLKQVHFQFLGNIMLFDVLPAIDR